MLPRILALLLLSAVPAFSADWLPYDNVRYGYTIELPPEFGLSIYPDSGDGLTLTPTDQSAKLRVFGTSMLNGDLSSEAKVRMALAKDDGWQISYSKMNSRGASFSGIRQDRIVYVRGVALCNGGAAFFQMDYPKADMHRFDAVVMRLVRSLQPITKCTNSTQAFKRLPATG
jgi:hypothetical protein